jgi:group I intron endonuclease
MPAKVFKFTKHTKEDTYLTGVYAIVNLVNNKFYIGSAVRTNKRKSACGFYARWSGHLCALFKGKHDNGHLQRSWNKHVPENFEFRILEFTEPEMGEEVEQIYLDTSDDSQRYNLNPNANSCLGVKRSKEFCDSLSKIHKGKAISEEHKQRLSEFFKNRFVKPFEIVSPDGQIIKGENLHQFSIDNNLSDSNLFNVTQGKLLHCKGWTSSLENHLLYKKLYDLRGIRYLTRYNTWSVNWRKERQISKSFKTLEEAKEFRDTLDYEWVIQFSKKVNLIND